MRRVVLSLIAIVFTAVTMSPAYAAKDGPDGTEPPDEPEEPLDGVRFGRCADISGFCVEAGEYASLQATENPGSTVIGRVVRCTFHEPIHGGAELAPGNNNHYQPEPSTPVEGRAVVIVCVYTDTGESIAGYPRYEIFVSIEDIPGTATPGYEVATFAKDLIEFEPPAPAVAPDSEQLVGVATWFAVTSPLAYPDSSAQTGATWATVRATFTEAIFDLGPDADGSRFAGGRPARRLDPDGDP